MRVVGMRDSRDSDSVMAARLLTSSTVTPYIGIGTGRPAPAGGAGAGDGAGAGAGEGLGAGAGAGAGAGLGAGFDGRVGGRGRDDQRPDA